MQAAMAMLVALSGGPAEPVPDCTVGRLMIAVAVPPGGAFPVWRGGAAQGARSALALFPPASSGFLDAGAPAAPASLHRPTAPEPIPAVPLPAPLWLLAGALAALFGLKRRAAA